MTEAEVHEIVRRYVDREITVEAAADDLGPGTAVVDVILAAKRLFGRLPDQQDAFTEGEYRRAVKILGLDGGRPDPASEVSSSSGSRTPPLP